MRVPFRSRGLEGFWVPRGFTKHVLSSDAATRAARCDEAQIHPEVPGQLAHRWNSGNPAVRSDPVFRPINRGLGRQFESLGVQPPHNRCRFRRRSRFDRGAIGVTNYGQDFPHKNRFARGHRQLQDSAGPWRRNLHYRLVGFHLDKRLIRTHPIALGHQPTYDFTLRNAFAYVREAKLQGHASTFSQYPPPSRVE